MAGSSVGGGASSSAALASDKGTIRAAQAAAARAKAAEVAPEDLIQAVVLADSFNKRFQPLTTALPKCLMPLVNWPLIEYTFELLAVAGVHQIILMVCYHSAAIMEYIANSKWSAIFKVEFIESQGSMNVGDALRELDRRNIVTGDFILLNADVVSNVNLGPILAAHKARRKADRNTLMTIVTTRANPNHRSRPGDEGVFVLNRSTSELLHFEPVSSSNPPAHVVVPLTGLQTGAPIAVRNDLLDCRIDICSPEVPALFAENYDYADVRSDFVNGILSSDILSRKIYVHIASEGYAARVDSVRTYGAISLDIMARWSFPLVPDTNFAEGSTYSYRRKHVYVEEGVVLARSCVAEGQVVLGRGTTIGANTRIWRSVIGRDCKIGDNVVIENAVLWDSAIVHDNSRVTYSIVGRRAEILPRTIVSPNCIVADGVVLGPDVTVPPATRVSLEPPEDEDDVAWSSAAAATMVTSAAAADDTAAKEAATAALGAHHVGYLWHSAKEAEDEDEDEDEDTVRVRKEGVTDYDPVHAYLFQPQRATDVPDDAITDILLLSDDESDEEVGEKGHVDFATEAMETVRRAITEKHPVENLRLELTSLRLTYNATARDLVTALVTVLIQSIDRTHLATSAKQLFTTWAPVLMAFVTPANDQQFVLDLAVSVCTQSPGMKNVFIAALQMLYQIDVLEGDTLISWHKSPQWRTNKYDESTLALHAAAKPLIAKLIELEAQEDDSDEDDEETSEDEEDEEETSADSEESEETSDDDEDSEEEEEENDDDD